MSKPMLGIVLGGILGVFDGLSALISAPEVAPEILLIVIGSTAGGLIGWASKKIRSLAAGLAIGLAVGAFFAFLVAMNPQPSGEHYWWQIMLPGSAVGLLVGYATQKWGGERRRAGAALPSA
jgi:hypothetical protein